jgi:hypothetical protein
MAQRNLDVDIHSRRLVLVLLWVAVFVVLMGLISSMIRERFPEGFIPPPVIISTVGTSQLSVHASVISTTCVDAETIDFSVVEVSVSGGTPPYDLTIINSQLEQSGPYVLLVDNEPLPLKVYGGDYFRVQVRSAKGEPWSGQIGLPVEVDICRSGFAPTPETTTTLVINTAAPSATETIVPSSTFTPISTPTPTLFQWTATNTRGPRPDNTNTTVPATATARPQPSDTPRPPEPTVPPPTQPKATNIPKSPAPTPIIPNPRQCEDGKDNDRDGNTDYPSDPDCGSRSDDSE